MPEGGNWYPTNLSTSVPRAQIDLDALESNLREVERLVGPAVSVLAMVKANAYGHGAPQVARHLYQAGCRSFGVVSIAEARTLADLAEDARVVIFGGILPSEAPDALACRAEVVTQEADVVSALAAVARDSLKRAG